MNQKIGEINYYIVIDKTNKAGIAKVYVRFLQNGKKTDHFLKIRWPHESFDRLNGLFLLRYPNDKDAEKNNIIVNEIRDRLNKLAADKYISNKHYTIQDYINVIERKDSLTNFAVFMTDALKYQQVKGIIAYETYKKQMSISRKIKQFFGNEIPMSSLSIEKIQEFDAYYRKLGRKHNTIVSYHKTFAKFIALACEKGLIERNPYERIKHSFIAGDRVALTQDEIKKLYKIFEEQSLALVEHEVLRRFLFSCLTGIRISDTHFISAEMIKGSVITFVPQKTKKTGKQVKIPLPVAALKLIEGKKGKLFVPFADQSINRILKRIAAFAEINPKLSYHSARDSFGTIFIELGGDVKSLSDLMGHGSTRVTEIYLKMSDQRKVKLMNNFDQMF